MTKAQAGRLGGLSTYRKHGTIHMQKIGKRGAVAFWNKYKLQPIGTANFAIVERATGNIVNFMIQWR